ncbi:MAG TPA: flagellar biosynthetic protein FliR [Bryobacteraceae bacterium]|nr:flagellar biosynthetic protein FliR [Bryobacteraceae bacterium]
MHASLHVSSSLLISFLLVLARMVGVFVFVPMPFKDAGPSLTRTALALGCTLALYARWPVLNLGTVSITTLLALIVPDAVMGASIGLLVSFLSEAFTLGAQSLALQAGYGYASVVDPTTQADSDVLAVLAQLLAGLLFFTAGLHRKLIQLFAESLSSYPPGTFALTQNLAKEVIHVGAGIFSFGLRLALPIIGLLLMTEVTLALLGRINAQLHVGQHAFPVKMMVTLLVLSSILTVTPHLYGAYADEVIRLLQRMFVR